ncbi:MAG: hypothetical protein QOF02_390 [Blastocatellia bacterium]|jgi:hypothetical protein|nr:hypothetical protein [Blastocatellia bacterium]
MSAVKMETLKEICDGVWRDRAGILFWRGALSGEDALRRAVYWRLCKTGAEPDENRKRYAHVLQKLVEQYINEAAGHAC